MKSLIVGGTSGLGLEVAKKLYAAGGEIYVAGRRELNEPTLHYKPFDLAAPHLSRRVSEFVMGLPKVNTFVYAAGYFQDGLVTDLTERQIEEMLDVGARGLIYFVRALL